MKTKAENIKADWRYLTTVPAIVWVLAEKFEKVLKKNDRNGRKRG